MQDPRRGALPPHPAGHRGNRRVRPDGAVQHADLQHGGAAVQSVLLQPDGWYRRGSLGPPEPGDGDDQAHPRAVGGGSQRRLGAGALLPLLRVAAARLLPRPHRRGRARDGGGGVPGAGAAARAGGRPRRGGQEQHPRLHPRPVPRARVLHPGAARGRRGAAAQPGQRAQGAAAAQVPQGAGRHPQAAVRAVPAQDGGLGRAQRPGAGGHGQGVRGGDQRRRRARHRHRLAERG
mmetsp:Transcript_35146/g.86197  ORF Transcript_35146/g.86197 Transcript_35146/m.86197 type:complete len:234 (-) Transcript_35146:1728-2429(-)